MEEMAQEFHEQEVNNTAQEYNTDFANLQPFLVLVCIIGIITNAALLYILTKTNLRNTQNALILSLTLSNLLYVLFFLPFDITAIGSQSYPFTETLCKATEFINSICFFVLPFTLIALSARCIIDKSDDRRTPKSIVVAVIVIWSVAVVVALPSMLLAYSSEHEDVVYCPMYGRGFNELEILVQFFTILAVPVMAVSCYICDLRKRNRLGNTRNREQKDVVQLVLVLNGVYTLCLIPRSFLDVFSLFFWFKYDSFYHGVNVTGLLLHLAYPIAFVVALFCASTGFRQLFKQHLLFWCESENEEAVVDREPGAQPLVLSARAPVTLPPA